MEAMAIEIREVHGLHDLERWVEVQNEAVPHRPERLQMMVLVRATELEHVDLLALVDGEPAGAAMLAGDPHSVQTRRPYVEIAVPDRFRGRGIGSALLDAVNEQARRRGYEGLWCAAREGDERAMAFWHSRGFVETHRRERCTLEVASAPAPVLPEGVELAPFADCIDALADMHQVARTTYPEFSTHFAGQTSSLHEWQLYELGDAAILLELTLVAFAHSEVIGFATARTAPEQGWGSHQTVAVLPQWRRLGVGSALIHAQLEAAGGLGLEQLTVWCMSEQAARFFASLGYQPIDVEYDLAGPPI
jgi:ribosomal protein S18 acetylase RimI-like enzyme